MPYEATVPVHRRLLWPAVADPERLLAALPNAVIDASGSQGVAGRLKLRVRDQSVTFRGIARIVEIVPSALRVSVEVEAAFGRADGSVEGVVQIALRQSGSGTRVVVSAELDTAGAPLGFPPQALEAAMDRLVRRWFTALAASSPGSRPERAVAAAQDPQRPQDRAAALVVVRDPPGGTPVEELAEPAAQPAAEEQFPAEPEAVPAVLRLIPPEPQVDGTPEAESSAEGKPPVEPDDIWTKAGRHLVPRWLTLLLGAFTAALGAAVLLAAVLRRRHRR